MALKLITAPSTLPVSLAEAKLHLRIDAADEDALVTALISAATQGAEQETGRAIMPQTWAVTLDAFPEAIELMRTPVQSVTSVKYFDEAGVQQTLPGSLYSLDNSEDAGFAYVVPAYDTDWPDTRDQVNAVEVIYTAGYADAAAVPEIIKAWIKLRVGALFENREAWTLGKSIEPNPFVDRLLDPYRLGF